MKFTLAFAAAALALGISSASASVVDGAVTSGSGDFTQLDGTSTFTVGNNNFQSPDLFAFDELQNVLLTADLAADVGLDPILAGTVVSSHYVFFDSAPFVRQQGYVDFSSEILGIATSTATLAASDFLGSSSVTYLNPTLRGLEAGDSASIDGTLSTRLLVNWRASTPGDYIRVFTAGEVSPVPVPAGLVLMLTALGGLGAARKLRKA